MIDEETRAIFVSSMPQEINTRVDRVVGGYRLTYPEMVFEIALATGASSLDVKIAKSCLSTRILDELLD